uniref:Uncharacterized protein n=1 Tax=Arundo donax TaxID=35708 RepID=A0A0A9G7F1_ARUDO
MWQYCGSSLNMVRTSVGCRPRRAVPDGRWFISAKILVVRIIVFFARP